MAVYTPMSEDEIRAFLQGYDLPGLARAEGIRAGIENTNYLLVLEDGSKRILTLFEKRVQAADLPFFVRLMEHLAKAGIACPLPVSAKNGEALQSVKNKSALIVTFLQGAAAPTITAEHTYQLGALAASMHKAAEGFSMSRPNPLSLAGWRTLMDRIGAHADEVVPGLAAELQQEFEYLNHHWPSHLPQGILHADLFHDNVFFDGRGRLSGVIDFYFACNDSLVYELAICLNAWCCDDSGACIPELSSAMLRGYSEVRPLSAEERKAIPILSRGAAFRFLLTRSHDWLFTPKDAVVTRKDPGEYLAKSRFHRHAALKDYGL